MVDFDTREKWQGYFDEKFPEGLLLSITDDGVMMDGTTQVLSAKISVSEVVDGTPEIVVVDYDTDAILRFDVDDVVEENPNWMSVRTVTGKVLLLSDQLSELQKEILKERREGGIWS